MLFRPEKLPHQGGSDVANQGNHRFAGPGAREAALDQGRTITGIALAVPGYFPGPLGPAIAA